MIVFRCVGIGVLDATADRGVPSFPSPRDAPRPTRPERSGPIDDAFLVVVCFALEPVEELHRRRFGRKRAFGHRADLDGEPPVVAQRVPIVQSRDVCVGHLVGEHDVDGLPHSHPHGYRRAFASVGARGVTAADRERAVRSIGTPLERRGSIRGRRVDRGARPRAGGRGVRDSLGRSRRPSASFQVERRRRHGQARVSRHQLGRAPERAHHPSPAKHHEHEPLLAQEEAKARVRPCFPHSQRHLRQREASRLAVCPAVDPPAASADGRAAEDDLGRGRRWGPRRGRRRDRHPT